MGVKFGREYVEIIEEMSEVMSGVRHCHEWFEMSGEDWRQMDDEERNECISTLADDIFYGLGADPSISFGTCQISYDSDNHIIKISSEDNIVHVIRLI